MVEARTKLSKEDICVPLCQLRVETGRAGSLSGSQHSYNSEVIHMQKQVCPSEEVHYGSARVQQWMVAQVTQGHSTGCIVSIKGNI